MPFISTHSATTHALILTAALLAAGCGTAQSGDPNGPVIKSFRFEQQFPGDPLTAVFVIAFDSKEGRLGGGKARFYVGTKTEPLELSLGDLMVAGGLAREAKSGEVGAALRFSQDVTDGATVKLGLVLVDELGRQSNRAEVTLKFTY